MARFAQVGNVTFLFVLSPCAVARGCFIVPSKEALKDMPPPERRAHAKLRMGGYILGHPDSAWSAFTFCVALKRVALLEQQEYRHGYRRARGIGVVSPTFELSASQPETNKHIMMAPRGTLKTKKKRKKKRKGMARRKKTKTRTEKSLI